MHISYFNNGILKQNVNKHTEIRIHSEKIASRFFGTVSKFTWSCDSLPNDYLFYPSKKYKVDTKYDSMEIQKFILNESFSSKLSAVIRNPKDRMVTALAQIIFRDRDYISFNDSFMYLDAAINNDVHLDRYHEKLYNIIFIADTPINLNNRFLNEDVFIEDIDNITYYNNSDQYQKNTRNLSNDKYKLQVEEFISNIYSNHKNSKVYNWMVGYLDYEFKYYYKLKDNSK